jgi:hypothetical protein
MIDTKCDGREIKQERLQTRTQTHSRLLPGCTTYKGASCDAAPRLVTVSATACCRIWKSPPGPVSIYLNQFGSALRGESTLRSGDAYKSMMCGCLLAPVLHGNPRQYRLR